MNDGRWLWAAFAAFSSVFVVGVVLAVFNVTSRRRLPLALVAVGLAGSLGTGIAALVDGGGMMGGRMMGGGMMAPPGGSAPPPVEGATAVVVVADEFGFEPGQLTLRAGETVNVTLGNRGDAFHTFTVVILGFELRADGGARSAGALTATESGTFEYVCAVPGHEQAGMRGTLVVE